MTVSHQQVAAVLLAAAAIAKIRFVTPSLHSGQALSRLVP
jgi:hypothetical protein